MAEINWTHEAQSWLKDIYDYIAADNPEAAARTVEGIYERSQLLKQHPEAGYRYETQSDRAVRILLYGHYRITYLTKPDGNIDVLDESDVAWTDEGQLLPRLQQDPESRQLERREETGREIELPSRIPTVREGLSQNRVR